MSKIEISGRYNSGTLFKKALLFMTAVSAAAAFCLAVWSVWHSALPLPYDDELVWTADISAKIENPEFKIDYSRWAVFYHRSPVPRFIQVQLALWSRWNLQWECLLNLLLVSGVFACIAMLIRRADVFWPPYWKRLSIIASCLCLYSSAGYLNWIWGEMMVPLTCYLLCSCALVRLSRPVFAWKDLLISGLLAFAAVFSWTSGFAVWGAGLLLLLMRRGSGGREKALASFVWLLMGGLTAFLFFQNLESARAGNLYDSLHLVLFKKPGNIFHFMMVYFGKPLGHLRSYAFLWWAGLFGLELYVLLTACVWIKWPEKRPLCIAFSAPGIFAVLNGFLVTLGRGRFGMAFSTEITYYLPACFLWISVFLQGLLVVRESFNECRALAVLLSVLLSVVFAAMSFSSVMSYLQMREMVKEVNESYRAILSAGNREEAEKSWPVLKRHTWLPLQYITDNFSLLKKSRLAVFRSDEALNGYLARKE